MGKRKYLLVAIVVDDRTISYTNKQAVERRDISNMYKHMYRLLVYEVNVSSAKRKSQYEKQHIHTSRF